MFLIVLPLAARMSVYQVWANTTMAVCESFLGMTVALFTAVLAINIFKDSNEEGTELIVISKPISRKTIVWTKFFTFFSYCLMVNISAVIITALTWFIPKTEPQFYWGLVVSMFIGNLVSFGVFGSLAVVISAKFAKVGIIIANIVVSLVFLVYQTLTLFVFRTPLKAVTDDNITPDTYIYAKRNLNDWSYEEKELVDFESVPFINAQGEPEYAIKCNTGTWQDIVDYWEGNVKAKDPTKILNVTDFAGQVSLSYLSAGINKFSERQARRIFAISRFWDYKLTSPASPELIEHQNHKTVKADNWEEPIPLIYAEDQKYNVSGADVYIPSTCGSVGVRATKAANLSGFAERVPIGNYKKAELFTRRDVYFEKEDYDKYHEGFEDMYDNVFNSNLKEGQYYKQDVFDNPCDYQKTWSHTENLARYYDLVWIYLMNKAEDYNVPVLSHPDFDVHSVWDLNDRFLQFKYFCFYKAYEDQQDILRNNPTIEAEVAERLNIISELNNFFPYISVKNSDEGWMLQDVIDSASPIHLLETGSETVDFTALERLRNSSLSDDIKKECSLAMWEKYAAIFNTTCDPTENYMFKSIESPMRTAEYYGEVYTFTKTWSPYLVNALGVPTGLNMCLFFYEAQKTTNFWVYALVWILISTCLFGAGVVVYNKYDVK